MTLVVPERFAVTPTAQNAIIVFEDMTLASMMLLLNEEAQTDFPVHVIECTGKSPKEWTALNNWRNEVEQ